MEEKEEGERAAKSNEELNDGSPTVAPVVSLMSDRDLMQQRARQRAIFNRHPL